MSTGPLHKETAAKAVRRAFEDARPLLRTARHAGQSLREKNVQARLAFSFGVVFIVVMLVIALLVPYPSQFQLLTFRVTLALAAAGVAATIPGLFSMTIPSFLRAGGAAAVFAMVFFFNPAMLSVRGVPTSAEGVFVKEIGEDRGLVEYYWKQADLRFRFPASNWQISTRAAASGLGDLTLQHWSGKDAQMQMHVSVLDERYRDKWEEFKANTTSIWRGTVAQFGPFSAEDVYVDGRSAFAMHATIRGAVQGYKAVDLLYAPIGDNRLFEIHLTRNEDNRHEAEIVSAYNLVRSTIRFDRK